MGDDPKSLVKAMCSLFTINAVAYETVWVGRRGTKEPLKNKKFVEIMTGLCVFYKLHIYKFSQSYLYNKTLFSDIVVSYFNDPKMRQNNAEALIRKWLAHAGNRIRGFTDRATKKTADKM